MADITENTPQQDLDGLLKDRRALAFGLFWGCVVLFFFAFWIYARDQPYALAVGAFILAGVALVAGVYLLVSQRGQAAPQEQRIPKLRSDKRIFGLLLVVVGALLVIAGIAVGFQQKLSALGEAVGVCLTGLIAIGAGRMQLAGPQPRSFRDRIVDLLNVKRQPIGVVLIVVGTVLILVGAWLRWKTETEFPKWGGLLLLGIGLKCSGWWLKMAADVNGRLAVLVIGGVCGLVIALMTLAQAWLWRDVVFGGLSKWRDVQGWKIWVCAYLELFGLALMFSSLLSARADIRVNPVLRRILFGYNAVFTGLLLLAFLVVLNIVVYAAYPMTYDWSSSRGLYTISDSTQDILERLKKPATVYVLLSQSYPFYKDIRNLLDNCKVVTDQLRVDYISPDRDYQKYRRLSLRYPEILPDVKAFAQDEVLGRGLLVVYGPEADTPDQKPAPHAFIPSRKLVDRKGAGMPGSAPTIAFQGEKVLMTELLFLMEGQKKSKVYFLQGDEEMNLRQGRERRDLNASMPMSKLALTGLVERLKKENYDVRGLSFEVGKDDDLMHHVKAEGKDKRKEIPEDAGIVVIAGPSVPVAKETVEALERYMDKNGRLLVLLDVVVDPKFTEMKSSGLEEFLKKYNVEVTKDYVFRYPTVSDVQASRSDLSRVPFVVLSTTHQESDSILAKKFPFPFYLETARVLKPLTEARSYKSEVLLEVWQLATPYLRQRIFWPESNVRTLFKEQDIPQDELLAKMSREPLPVALTVKDDQDRPRMVVFGDADMACNMTVMAGTFYGIPVGENYFNILASSLDWLTQRPGVGARPKEAGVYTLNASISPARLVFLPGWLFSIAILGMGLGMWVVRRR